MNSILSGFFKVEVVATISKSNVKKCLKNFVGAIDPAAAIAGYSIHVPTNYSKIIFSRAKHLEENYSNNF